MQVLDGNQTVVWSDSVSGTTATVTGLSADTAYSVKVRALAAEGSTDYEDSDWSTAISVTTALADGLEWAGIFNERFSGMTSTTAWGGSTKILSSEGDLDDSLTDMDTWHGNTLYNAPGAPRFGNASNHGWVQSSGIPLSNNVSSASVKVTFSAIALHANAASALVFSVLDSDGTALQIQGVSPVTVTLPVVASPTTGSTVAAELAGAGGSPQSFSFTAPAGFKLKFDASSAGNSNVALDDILVEQIVDPDFAVLAAPAGVAESDVGKTGFSVSWTGVANASGYEVWLDGAVAGSCASTDTSMQLTGLADGTTYSVQVKALGDNLHYGDSPLSTAISVTTLEDAQKVVFTVTGAPTEPVTAGDTVSFTVTAEVEGTGTAAEVSFSGIASASFAAATGAFSWTPAESDVGPHAATFSSGAYSTNVAIEVASAFTTTNLFHETFANCDTKWSSSAAMPANGTTNSTTYVVESGWSFSHCYRGKSGLKMGTEKVYGTATSRPIEPKQAGTVSLSFRAAGNEAGSTLTVSVSGGASFSQTVTLEAFPSASDAIPDTTGFVFGPYDIAATGAFALSFTPASGDGRMGVDEILVTQTVSARLRDLDAPTGLAVDGEAGETGFTVGWTAVAGATNYAVRVTDASGAVVFSAPFCAGTSVAVASLGDDESYAVQVRATGDEALWFASPWSDALAVRTERSALHPTLSFGPWENAVGDGSLHAGLANTAAVSALLDDGTDVTVLYLDVSPAPVVGPAFSNGTLSWRPDDADTNGVFSIAFEMTPAEGVSYTTNVLCAVLAAPPLEPPAITVVSTGIKKASFAWDPEPQFRATGYLVRLWRGSKDYTRPGVCYEDFFDCTIPQGWAGTGKPGREWYSAKGYESSRVKFAENGDTLVSKLHSAPVTNLTFHIRGTSQEPTSLWTLYGSSGGTNETDWTQIRQAGPTTGDVYQPLDAENNYRRFKWVFTKDSGTMGLGQIAAEHEGAGAKFVNGYGTAAAAQSVGTARSLMCDTLHAETEYFLEVAVTDGVSSVSSLVRFATLPAPKATVMIVK